jgi:hypothetical protein
MKVLSGWSKFKQTTSKIRGWSITARPNLRCLVSLILNELEVWLLCLDKCSESFVDHYVGHNN